MKLRRPAPVSVLMLLTNTYDPDPRVRQEALTLLQMGCQVRLLAWDRDCRSPLHELIEGIQVDRIRLASTHGRGTTQLFFYLLLYFRFFLRAWRTPFDIVHCHDLDTLPVGFFIGKCKRKPIVYDSHESFLDMLQGSIHPLLRRVLQGIEDFLIAHVDLLITVGEKLRQHFEGRGAKHAVVVGNWKDIRKYGRTLAQNEQLRRELQVPPGVILITCISQLLKNR